jgi:hypothetical protein
VSAGLPYVFAKYTARNLPPPPIPVLSWDACHCRQSGFQDFGFRARYNVFNGGFALTPSVSFGTPSHNYEFRGEAVVGRNLKELQFAVDVVGGSTLFRKTYRCRAATPMPRARDRRSPSFPVSRLSVQLPTPHDCKVLADQL